MTAALAGEEVGAASAAAPAAAASSKAGGKAAGRKAPGNAGQLRGQVNQAKKQGQDARDLAAEGLHNAVPGSQAAEDVTVRAANAGGGFLLGLFTWALAMNYLRGGSPQVRKFLAAKFLNRTPANPTGASSK